MQVPFRQGIVKSVPNFLQLTGSTVSLVVPQPAYILVTIADGSSDYLISESSPVTNAWTGPFAIGTDYWLFWDIHPTTGIKTYGHTLHEPTEGAIAPQSPFNDQHWYDSTSHKMKVWNAVAGRWIEKIRVFAARLTNSSQLISMSINSPAFEGTQVGSYVSTPVLAGYLVLDNEGKALRKGNGKFFTTEDVGVAGVTNTSRVKFSSIVREAESTANMAANTIVAFTSFDVVEPADPLMVSQGKLFGIIEDDVVIGDYVNVVFEGMVSSSNWDWTPVGINAPLYIGEGGVLSTTATAPALDPIAVVSGIHSIQFGVPKVINNVVGGTTVGVMTNVAQGTGRLSLVASNPADPVVVGDNDPRLADARVPVSHTHTIADVTNLQLALDDRVAKAGDTMVGTLTLSGAPTLPLHAATKAYVDANVGGGGGGGVEPVHQILYGTGTGVSSSPMFSVNVDTGLLSLQVGVVATPEDITLRAASTLVDGSTNPGGSVILGAGNGENASGNGGGTFIYSGGSNGGSAGNIGLEAGHSIAGNGGTILLYAGHSGSNTAGGVELMAGNGRWGGDVNIGGGDCVEDFTMAGKITLEGGRPASSYNPGPGGYVRVKGGDANGSGAEIFTLGGTGSYNTVGTVFANAEQVVHVMSPGGLNYINGTPHANITPCYRRFIVAGSGTGTQFNIPVPVVMPDASSWLFNVDVLATTETNTLQAAFHITGVVKSNFGTLSMQYQSTSIQYQPAGTEFWNISAFADAEVSPTLTFIATPDSVDTTHFVMTVNITQYALMLA